MAQCRRPFIARITKILYNESGKIVIFIYMTLKLNFKKGSHIFCVTCIFLLDQISINLADSFNIHI